MKHILLAVLALTAMSNADILENAIKGCENGNGADCATAGYQYQNKDDVKSLEYYSKALKLLTADCNAKDGDACSSLSAMYEYGQGLPKNIDKAVEYELNAYMHWSNACMEGNEKLCDKVGEAWFSNYKLVPKNPKYGKKYLEKGCELNNPSSCSALGHRYVGGYDVQKNIGKGVELLQKASKLGHETAQKKLDEVCRKNPSACK